MALSREAIAALIPHADSMCLLERVDSWNEGDIVCIATSHRDPSNPLRRGDALPAISGLEYAAQAMAAHGALCRGEQDKPMLGFLTSVRDLRVAAESLEGLSDLTIRASLLAGDELRVLYQFTVSAGAEVVLAGRATVLLRCEAGSGG